MSQTIEVIRLDFVVPLPYNVCVIGREEDSMLRQDMTRIESRGINKIDPILLRRLTPEETEEYRKKGKPAAQYMIVDGHRRWQAAIDLGWSNIRAIITDITPEEGREFNYKKNKARGNVDPLREALYFKHLYHDLRLTQEKIAERFGIDQSYVSKVLKRIKISPEASRVIATAVATGKKFSGKHIETVASLEKPEKQKELADIIVEQKLSTKQAEVAKEAIEEGLPKEEVVKKAKAPSPPKQEWEPFTCEKCGQEYRINWKQHLIETLIS